MVTMIDFMLCIFYHSKKVIFINTLKEIIFRPRNQELYINLVLLTYSFSNSIKQASHLASWSRLGL